MPDLSSNISQIQMPYPFVQMRNNLDQFDLSLCIQHDLIDVFLFSPPNLPFSLCNMSDQCILGCRQTALYQLDEIFWSIQSPFALPFEVFSEEGEATEDNHPTLKLRMITRRGRDSNPRYLAVNTLSKRARSATLTPLLIFKSAKITKF